MTVVTGRRPDAVKVEAAVEPLHVTAAETGGRFNPVVIVAEVSLAETVGAINAANGSDAGAWTSVIGPMVLKLRNVPLALYPSIFIQTVPAGPVGNHGYGSATGAVKMGE